MIGAALQTAFVNLLYCLFILKTLNINWGTPFYVSKESAQCKTVDYYGLRYRGLYLAFPYALGNVLTPFIMAAVLAYVLNPLVEWLQLKRIRRAPASMIIMTFALIVLLSLALIIVPMLLNQFNNLAERLPQIVGFVQNKLLPWLNSVSGDYIQIDQESIIAWLQSHTDELEQYAQRMDSDLDASERQRDQRRQQFGVVAFAAVLLLVGLETLVFRNQQIGSAPFYRNLHAYQRQYG